MKLKKSLGEDHPKVATALNNLASLLQDLNLLEDAEPMMRRALKIDEKSFGKDHPTVANDLVNLSILLCQTKRKEDGLLMLRSAYKIFNNSYGEDHPHTQTALKWVNHFENKK